jgi:peptidoglycan/LPS O-acetylase OafA/YrhL
MKFVGNISYLLMALIITVCIAIISWVFIEKKALSLKYKL